MTDEIWQRQEIESPCKKICVIAPEARLCVGCLRTPEEIARWSAMSPSERAAIMADLPDREGRIAKRTGGRKARLRRRSSTSTG